MIVIYCLDACTSTPLRTALHHVADLPYLPDLYTALEAPVAYLQASHTHAHATHASRHFPNHHACMHACIPIYIPKIATPVTLCKGWQSASNIPVRIYILAIFPTHNSACAIDFTHASACRTCTNHKLTSSHIHHSDEPNAIIFIQVLALSHRAHAGINLEQRAS